MRSDKVSFVLLLLTIMFGCSSSKCYSYRTNRIDKVKCLKIYDKDLIPFFSNIELWHGLERLTIYSDTLGALPDNICELKNLQLFSCNNSKLYNIEPLACLDSLRTISLYNNNIQTIPEAIYKLPMLRQLIIFSNKLSEQEVLKAEVLKSDSLMILTELRSKLQQ